MLENTAIFKVPQHISCKKINSATDWQDNASFQPGRKRIYGVPGYFSWCAVICPAAILLISPERFLRIIALNAAMTIRANTIAKVGD